MSSYCECRINGECRTGSVCDQSFNPLSVIIGAVAFVVITIGCVIAKRRRDKRFAELKKRNEAIEAQTNERRRQEFEAQQGAFALQYNQQPFNSYPAQYPPQNFYSQQPQLYQAGYPQMGYVQPGYNQPGMNQPQYFQQGIQTKIEPGYQPA